MQEYFEGGNTNNRNFQAAIVEGCQGMYTEMKTIEATVDALNHSTVALAHKSYDVANALNNTNKCVQAMELAVSDLRAHIKHVEGRHVTLKKQASRSVNVFAQGSTGIKNACAQTVHSLTTQLTKQCREFHDTLEG